MTSPTSSGQNHRFLSLLPISHISFDASLPGGLVEQAVVVDGAAALPAVEMMAAATPKTRRSSSATTTDSVDEDERSLSVDAGVVAPVAKKSEFLRLGI